MAKPKTFEQIGAYLEQMNGYGTDSTTSAKEILDVLNTTYSLWAEERAIHQKNLVFEKAFKPFSNNTRVELLNKADELIRRGFSPEQAIEFLTRTIKITQGSQDKP